MASDTCPKNDGGPHCPHSAGGGMTQGDGRAGWWRYQCCRCGEQARVSWSMRNDYVKGHGPHHTVQRQVTDWPKEWEPTHGE